MKKSLLLLVIAIITLTTAFNANTQWTDRNTFNFKDLVKACMKAGQLWNLKKMVPFI